MLGDLQIEALTHGCAKCGKPFADTHFVSAAYFQKTVRSFAKQIEIGIAGQGVRNVWVHLDCADPSVKEWKVTPNIHKCIRCKKEFSREDLIQPAFQIVKPRAVNPHDPTDVGIELGDRVYFIHADCGDAKLKQSLIIT